MNGEPVERPQHLFMRVAVGIHKEDIDAAIEVFAVLCEIIFILNFIVYAIMCAVSTCHFP